MYTQHGSKDTWGSWATKFPITTQTGGPFPWFSTDHYPPPSLGSFSQHGLPVFHKLKVREFRHLLSLHEHNNIPVTPGYDYYASSSWFSELPFQFKCGNLCVSGCKFPDNLHNYQGICCSQPHAHDALSCIAHCPKVEHPAQAFVAAWPTPFTLTTQQWWPVAHIGKCRHFIRTVVPKSVWHSLSVPKQGIIKLPRMLLLGQALINRRPGNKRAIYSALEWFGHHPLHWAPIKMTFPLSPRNPSRMKYGPFSTSSSPPAPPPTPCLPFTRSAAIGGATEAEAKTKTKTKAQASALPLSKLSTNQAANPGPS